MKKLIILAAILTLPNCLLAQQTVCTIETTSIDFPGQFFFNSFSGDIDGDGDIDLVSYDPVEDRYWVFQRDKGKYFFRSFIDVDNDSSDTPVPHLVDMDGDGDLDFVSTKPADRQVVVAYNNGIGDFETFVEYDSTVTGSLARITNVGDIDGDSDIDVALTVGPGSGIRFIEIFINDGTGSLKASNVLIEVGRNSSVAGVVDIDNDQDLDLVVNGRISNNGTQQFAAQTFLNDGSGTFSANPIVSFFETSLLGGDEIHFGDLNNDSFLDLVVADFAGGVICRFGNGDGNFQDEIIVSSIADVFYRDEVGILDIDQDGLLDLVVGNSSNAPQPSVVGFFLNEGDGVFRQDLGVDLGFSPNDIVLDDFDNDGVTEICVPYSSGNIEIIEFQCQEVLLGDVNLDGEVNLLDVAPFVNVVTEGQFQIEADVNRDNAVDLLDVGPFVELLTN